MYLTLILIVERFNISYALFVSFHISTNNSSPVVAEKRTKVDLAQEPTEKHLFGKSPADFLSSIMQTSKNLFGFNLKPFQSKSISALCRNQDILVIDSNNGSNGNIDNTRYSVSCVYGQTIDELFFHVNCWPHISAAYEQSAMCWRRATTAEKIKSQIPVNVAVTDYVKSIFGFVKKDKYDINVKSSIILIHWKKINIFFLQFIKLSFNNLIFVYY